MIYWNSYTIYWDTYIDKYYDPLAKEMKKYFAEKEYSSEIKELHTIINCSPGNPYSLRKSFSRKSGVIFFDIVMDYDAYMQLPAIELKKEHIALSFLRDMGVLSKFKPKGFDLSQLKKDCLMFFVKAGWLSSSYLSSNV